MNLRAKITLFFATAYGVVVILAVAVTAHASESKPVPLVICDTFGRWCDQALNVSWCESRWRTTARNGQYRGLFQMGAWERRAFGHGPDARTQARAALRYFVRTGRDWSPWECKPS